MGMTLAAAYPILIQEIEAALEAAAADAKNGELDNANSVLAQKLGTAIHNYTMQAVVNTFVNTAVVGAGGGVPGPMVGTGIGAGNGTLS